MNARLGFMAILFLALCGASSLLADKFELQGEVLLYDTDDAPEGENEINWDDVDELLEILNNNPQIKTLHLKSGGGLIDAAIEMAETIMAFNLDTRVSEVCESACVTLFLASTHWSLRPRGELGFHRSSWDSTSMQTYYQETKFENGSASPFDFSSWVYLEAQNDVLIELKYLLKRGVSADFAIKTLRAESFDMWYPRRALLEAAGVISSY